jgi:hypothetical protein
LTCRGGAHPAARLADISEGGAWIKGAPNLAVEESGLFRIEGFDQHLRFMVRGHEEDALHVEFEAGSEWEAYRRWFNANIDRKAA